MTRADDHRRSHARDFGYIILFVEASMLAGDDTIVTDFATWLASVLAARGLLGRIVPLSIGVLRDCLPDGFRRPAGCSRR